MLTNVSLTTADANTTVRTHLEITRVNVYQDMTSTLTADVVPVTCIFSCHTINRNTLKGFDFIYELYGNRLLYWHLHFMPWWIYSADAVGYDVMRHNKLLYYQVHVEWHNFSDIDECRTESHNCHQLCNNLPGTYNCSCNTGFMLNNDGRICSGRNLGLVIHFEFRSKNLLLE